MATEPAVSNLVKSIIESVEKLSSATNRVEELSSGAAVSSGFPAGSVKNSSVSSGLSAERVDTALGLPSSIVESGVSKPADTVSKSVNSVQSSSSPPPVVSREKAASKGAADNIVNQFFEDRIINEHARWEETNYFLECDPFLHHVNEYTNWFNNSQQIVRHQSRPCVRPQALTIVTCAFGNLMAPKLAASNDDSLRESSLTTLLNAAFNETACIMMENVKHKESLG